MKPRAAAPTIVERATTWIGSVASLFVHTLAFLAAFALGIFHVATWELILLVLTTVVSLEAIYLAIFIQITVNQNTESLREVEEDIDEIQEDVEELGEDLDEIQEDIEEISEDIDEIQEDVEELNEEEDEDPDESDTPKEPREPRESKEERVREPREPRERKERAPKDGTATEADLEQITRDVQKILATLEALKKGQ
jgi:TolA-binding protein